MVSNGNRSSEDRNNEDKHHTFEPCNWEGNVLPIDDVFHILSDGRRRVILEYLQRHSQQTVVSSEEIIEYICSVGPSASDSREDIRISLHHNHIKKLEDVGLVEYDRDSKEVKYEADKRVKRWLAYIEAGEPKPATLGGE